jgi:hypothetical protein
VCKARTDSHVSFFPSSRPNPKRSHQLRYVLRNRSSNAVYLVILFTLYLREDINEDGSLKPAAVEATKKASGGVARGHDPAQYDYPPIHGQAAVDEARRKFSEIDLEEEQSGAETNGDDVD